MSLCSQIQLRLVCVVRCTKVSMQVFSGPWTDTCCLIERRPRYRSSFFALGRARPLAVGRESEKLEGYRGEWSSRSAHCETGLTSCQSTCIFASRLGNPRQPTMLSKGIILYRATTERRESVLRPSVKIKQLMRKTLSHILPTAVQQRDVRRIVRNVFRFALDLPYHFHHVGSMSLCLTISEHSYHLSLKH